MVYDLRRRRTRSGTGSSRHPISLGERGINVISNCVNLPIKFFPRQFLFFNSRQDFGQGNEARYTIDQFHTGF